MSEVGYKKPPIATRFGQPNGNPVGKTSDQRKAEIANAESATRLRTKMLSGLERQLEKAESQRQEIEDAGGETEVEDAAIAMITANILKLLKDSEDRGLGTPVQTVDNTSSDGTMTPASPVNLSNLSDKELKQLERLTDKAANPEGVGEA